MREGGRETDLGVTPRGARARGTMQFSDPAHQRLELPGRHRGGAPPVGGRLGSGGAVGAGGGPPPPPATIGKWCATNGGAANARPEPNQSEAAKAGIRTAATVARTSASSPTSSRRAQPHPLGSNLSTGPPREQQQVQPLGRGRGQGVGVGRARSHVGVRVRVPTLPHARRTCNCRLALCRRTSRRSPRRRAGPGRRGGRGRASGWGLWGQVERLRVTGESRGRSGSTANQGRASAGAAVGASVRARRRALLLSTPSLRPPPRMAVLLRGPALAPRALLSARPGGAPRLSAPRAAPLRALTAARPSLTGLCSAFAGGWL